MEAKTDSDRIASRNKVQNLMAIFVSINDI